MLEPKIHQPVSFNEMVIFQSPNLIDSAKNARDAATIEGLRVRPDLWNALSKHERTKLKTFDSVITWAPESTAIDQAVSEYVSNLITL